VASTLCGLAFAGCLFAGFLFAGCFLASGWRDAIAPLNLYGAGRMQAV